MPPTAPPRIKIGYATRQQALVIRRRSGRNLGAPYTDPLTGWVVLGHLPPPKSKKGIRRREFRRVIEALCGIVDEACGLNNRWAIQGLTPPLGQNVDVRV